MISYSSTSETRFTKNLNVQSDNSLKHFAVSKRLCRITNYLSSKLDRSRKSRAAWLSLSPK